MEGCPVADQIRRRLRRPLPHQAGGARGQGPARRVAGAQGSCLQRGQDARRLPQRGLRLPGVQRPPLRQQAADQTEQGGPQTDPGEAPHRAALPARDQRSGGDQTAQPDHPGVGRLLPDTGLQRGVQRSWITTCGRLTYKWARYSHENKPKSWVVRPVLRQVQQVQAGPVGVRRPQQRRLPPQVLLDPVLRHQIVRPRRPRTTPRLPTTGPGGGAKACPCRSTRPPRSSPTPRMVAARSAAASCSPSRTSRRTRASGRQWLATRTAVITTAVQPGSPEEAAPRLTHAECRRGLGPELRNAYEPSGLA